MRKKTKIETEEKSRFEILENEIKLLRVQLSNHYINHPYYLQDSLTLYFFPQRIEWTVMGWRCMGCGLVYYQGGAHSCQQPLQPISK